MKFAHLSDCHLGGWRFPELQEVNMQSFSMAIERCIKEKVDMVLIAGDLFDSAYPSMDTLKRSFAEFRKLKDSNISCFIIAGSHDYSASGKTFLDVLEHAGFCKNVYNAEERGDKIILTPVIHEKYAIYGYPGMKSGLEVEGLKKVILQDAPGFFKIFMLHTTLTEAIGKLPVESISINELPKADYYALGHLHIDFGKPNIIYSGPIFPNNFEELEELRYGKFYIIQVNGYANPLKIDLKIKNILAMTLKIENPLTATEKIISELNKNEIEDKIILLRLEGEFSNGKISDIRFDEIEKFAKDNGAYCFVKNTSKLSVKESRIEIESKDMHEVEETILEDYLEKTNSRFNDKVSEILRVLSIEKQEDEKTKIFEDRLIGEIKTVINF